MLNPDLVPSSLVSAEERSPIVINEEREWNSRSRAVHIAYSILELIITLFRLKITARLSQKQLGIELRRIFSKNGGTLD